MSGSVLKLDWKRILIEGGVIVVSILLAFAIDAWWDNRQDYEAQTQRMIRVAAELQANIERVGQKRETLDEAIAANSTILSWMGPEPDDVSLDEYSRLDESAVSIGMFSLLRRASDEYFSSATGDLNSGNGIRGMMDEWYWRGKNIEQQYDRLRNDHQLMGINMTELPHYSIRQTMRYTSVMDEHPESRFPIDLDAYLSDPVAENYRVLYLVRLEFVTRQMQRFQERQQELSELINAEIESRLR